MGFAIRRGTRQDSRAAADLWLRARRAALGAIPPPAHDDDDVREYFASRVVPEMELWVAVQDDGDIAGILVLDGRWVQQLYVEPALTGRGIGARLLDVA